MLSCSNLGGGPRWRHLRRTIVSVCGRRQNAARRMPKVRRTDATERRANESVRQRLLGVRVSAVKTTRRSRELFVCSLSFRAITRVGRLTCLFLRNTRPAENVTCHACAPGRRVHECGLRGSADTSDRIRIHTTVLVKQSSRSDYTELEP